MGSLSILDMVKMSFRVLHFKYEQNKLTSSEHSIVETTKGAVKGVKRHTIWDDAYISFEGIPFAKPPLGELRFRAPQPAEPWTGVKDCTGPAEKPVQWNMLFRKPMGSEDCLYLNVYTKNITPEKLKPVMVWIYGGGFQLGEASRNMYSPDYLMSSDIVLVSIAYRLGAFGFLSLDDPTVDVPGNAGIKDQILSLKWVKENISSFGGDPNNVTLFGESAGGASTHICMVSEQSKGLIHKGIVMSGSALCSWARPPQNQWAYRLAGGTGYEGENKAAAVYKHLLEASVRDIMKATNTLLKKEEKRNRVLFAFGPVVEPYVTDQCIFSVDPLVAMQTTWSNQIPMLIGGCSFEGLLFLPEVTRRPATLDEVKNCVNLLPQDLDLQPESEEAEELALRLKKTHFGDSECSRETMNQFLHLESYREFWHPIYRTILTRLQQSSAPTYVYRFDYDSQKGNSIRNLICGKNVRGTCHGDDLCYLFIAMFTYKATKETPEYRIVRSMVDIWTSFAAQSDPNCASLQEVRFEPVPNEAYKEETAIKCLNINEKLEFIELPEIQKLRVWNSLYPIGKL